MAVTKVVKTVFQLRRATAAEWELNKGIKPAPGEPCFDLTNNTLRIGNGIDTYENLKPIGGSNFEIATDGKSIVLKGNVLELAGFDLAEAGAQPRKTADGNIEWVVPSTETVEGLQATVAGLKSDVTGMQSTVTELREIVMPSGEDGSGTLLDRVESLENKVGTEDVDAKINAAINDFANKVDSDKVVNTFKELIDYVADHENAAADMVKDIVDLKALVGEGSVDERITAAVANKVTAEEGKSLIADTLIAKLETVEENAQVNKIEEIYLGDELLNIVNKKVTIPVGMGLKSSDEIEVAEDGTLKIKAISFDKIEQDEASVLIMDGGSAG